MVRRNSVDSWLVNTMLSTRSNTKRGLALVAYAFSNPYDYYTRRGSKIFALKEELSKEIDILRSRTTDSAIGLLCDKLDEKVGDLVVAATGSDALLSGEILKQLNTCIKLELVEQRERVCKSLTTASAEQRKSLEEILATMSSIEDLVQGFAQAVQRKLQREKSFSVAKYIAPIAAIFGFIAESIFIGPIVNILGRVVSKRGDGFSPHAFDNVSYKAEFGKMGASAIVFGAPIVTCGMIYGFPAVGAALQTGALATLVPGALLAKVTTFAVLGASIGFPPLAIAILAIAAAALVLYGVVKFAKFCYHKYQEHQLHKKGYVQVSMKEPDTDPMHAANCSTTSFGSTPSTPRSPVSTSEQVKEPTHLKVSRRLGFEPSLKRSNSVPVIALSANTGGEMRRVASQQNVSSPRDSALVAACSSS